MTYYVGQLDIRSILGDGNPRYFLALRRNDLGELYFAKVDQIKDTDEIIINTPGLAENNFTEFEYGTDFFDGRLEVDHSRPYDNLYWDQYRWDERLCFYYMDENGNLVCRINQAYEYAPEQIV